MPKRPHGEAAGERLLATLTPPPRAWRGLLPAPDDDRGWDHLRHALLTVTLVASPVGLGLFVFAPDHTLKLAVMLVLLAVNFTIFALTQSLHGVRTHLLDKQRDARDAHERRERKQRYIIAKAEAALGIAVPLDTNAPCPTCAQPTVPGAAHCAYCGEPLAQADPEPLVCSHCLTRIPDDGKFCPACGQTAPAPKVTPKRAAKSAGNAKPAPLTPGPDRLIQRGGGGRHPSSGMLTRAATAAMDEGLSLDEVSARLNAVIEQMNTAGVEMPDAYYKAEFTVQHYSATDHDFEAALNRLDGSDDLRAARMARAQQQAQHLTDEQRVGDPDLRA